MSDSDEHRPVTIAQLLHAQVVDEDGRALGRVHDVRAIQDREQTPDGQPPRYRIDSLIVGRSGIRARLGLHRARHPEPLRSTEPLPWTDVIALEPGRVVVRRDHDA